MFKIKYVNRLILINSLVMLLIVMIVFGCAKKEDSTSSDKKTETMTGDIEISPDNPFEVDFDIKGNINGTVNAIYWGKKARVNNVMILGGENTKTTSYTDGSTVYVVTEFGGKKMGMKMDAKTYSKNNDKKDGEFDLTTFREKLKEYDKVGKEIILDKECDIYKSKDGDYKISVYKETIPLKFDMGEVVMVATKMNPNVKVTDEMFIPPKDVEYIEMDDMMKDVDNMKDKMKDLKDKSKEMDEIMKKYSK